MTLAFTADVLPQYVVGYPIHVAIVAKASEPDEEVLPLGPEPRGLAVHLLHLASGKEVTLPAQSARSRSGPDESMSGPRRLLLQPSRSARFLVDLSPIWPSSLEPGRVRVALVYEGGSGKVAVAPFVVERLPPTAEQAERLALAQPELSRGWIDWSNQVGEPTKYPMTPRKDDPARYYVLLRYFSGFPGPIRNANLGLIDVLDGFYAPEAALFRAEMAIVRHDKAGFRAHAGLIRGVHASSAWALQDLEHGGSPIAFVHRILHEEDLEPAIPSMW